MFGGVQAAGRVSVVVLVSAGMLACMAPLVPDRVHGALAAGQPRVVVLQSAANYLATGALEALVRDVKYPVAVFTLRADESPRSLAAGMAAVQPTVLVTLGGPAAGFARAYFPDLPTVVALVMTGQVRALSHNVAGIALDLPAYTEFSMYKMVLPQLRRVLAFYVPRVSKTLVASAELELRQLGIELVAQPVQQASEIPGQLDQHARDVDAVWLVADPVVMTEATFRYLRDETAALRLPLLCSTFEDFAYEGALMAVSIHLANVGAQAASLVQLIIEQGTQPKDIGIIAPIGGRLVVNQTVASRLGIAIPARIKPFISRLIVASE